MTSGGNNFIDFSDNRLSNVVQESKKLHPVMKVGDQVVLASRLHFWGKGAPTGPIGWLRINAVRKLVIVCRRLYGNARTRMHAVTESWGEPMHC